MAPMTDQQKIGFLLIALRHSGKTDWAGVGAELGLQTGTASKRLVYITQAAEKAGGGEGDGATTTPKKTPKKAAATPKKASARKASPKKMKMDNDGAKDMGDDDEEVEFEPFHSMGTYIFLPIYIFISYYPLHPIYPATNITTNSHFLDRKRRASSQKVATYKEETDTETEKMEEIENGGVKAEQTDNGENGEVENFVDAAESHAGIELEDEF